ncbi:MAG TPA: hypothetical protein VIM99_06850 [Blastocatellia bacterium]
MKSHRLVQVSAIAFALAFANCAPAYCQSPQNNPASPPQIQLVKDQVRKIGVARDVTVIMLSGLEYYGTINKIEPDGFEIAEVELKQAITIAYADVKKVEKGYGSINPSTGKRQKASKSRWILIMVGLASTGLLFWAVAKLGKPKPPATPFPQIP